MNHLYYIIAITLAVCLAGCKTDNGVRQQLDAVASMLRNNSVDSARKSLIEIDPVTESDSAYFFLLQAETDYRMRETTNFNDIDYSIRYYEKNTDKIKLANSYYYKACSYILLDSLPKDFFILLKKAEQLSETTKDYYLQNKVYAALTYANGAKNEIKEALKYAIKEYESARKSRDNRNVAYALIRLSVCYKQLNVPDSASYYIKQCEKLVSEVDDNDKAFFYNLLGESFTGQSVDSALHYYELALKFQKMPETYKNIADVYYGKGDVAKWDAYCDSALADAWYETKRNILAEIAQTNYEDNRIEGYKQATDTLIKTLEDYFNYEKNNFALEIQKKFDFEKQQTEYEKNVWIMIAVISLLTTICLSFVIYNKRNKRIIKQLEDTNTNLYSKIQNSDKSLQEYQRQLDFLRSQNEEIKANSDNLADIIASNQGMMESLKKEMDMQKVQHSKYVEIGKTIYDRILNIQSIVNYKEHFANCVYYFEITYPDRTKIFSPYSNLSIENKMFLICDDAALMHNDAQTAKILGIKESTVRSRRTKLKSKLS